MPVSMRSSRILILLQDDNIIVLYRWSQMYFHELRVIQKDYYRETYNVKVYKL